MLPRKYTKRYNKCWYYKINYHVYDNYTNLICFTKYRTGSLKTTYVFFINFFEKLFFSHEWTIDN